MDDKMQHIRSFGKMWNMAAGKAGGCQSVSGLSSTLDNSPKKQRIQGLNTGRHCILAKLDDAEHPFRNTQGLPPANGVIRLFRLRPAGQPGGPAGHTLRLLIQTGAAV